MVLSVEPVVLHDLTQLRLDNCALEIKVRSLHSVQWMERGCAVRIEGIAFGSGTGRKCAKQVRQLCLFLDTPLLHVSYALRAS